MQPISSASRPSPRWGGSAAAIPHTVLPLAMAMALTALPPAVAQSVPGVQVLGNHCGGGIGLPPSLGVSSPLSIGRTSMLLARNLVPANEGDTAQGALVAGWATDQWGGFALPLQLSAMGMTGCALFVRPDSVELFASPSTFMQWELAVPNLPALQGANLGVQVLFLDRQANAAGVGATPGLSLRIDPPDADTTLATQVTQNGITFVFARPVRVGRFVNGDWFVVGPAPIVDMLPPVATVGSRTMHGAMLDPDPSTVNQGYDTHLYTAQFANFYQPAQNRALGVSAQSPLLLMPGHALVKVESLPTPPGVPMLRGAAVLTAVDEVPYAGSFRPPYAGTDHAVRFHVGMIDWQQLQRLAPAGGMPSPAAVIDATSRVWLDHVPSWLGRMAHPADHMPDYGRDLASVLGEAALLANCAIQEGERRQLAVNLVQIGIDCFGNLRGGCRWSGLGGHASGRKLPILFAGLLLDDAAMLAVGHNYRSGRSPGGTGISYFGEDGQTFVVQETAPGVYNEGFGGYTAADVGQAEWGFSHADSPQNDHAAWTADSYRICCTVNGWIGHVLVARMLSLVDEWDHPVLFDYTDRYLGIQTVPWTRSWSPWTDRMWQLYRAQF